MFSLKFNSLEFCSNWLAFALILCCITAVDTVAQERNESDESFAEVLKSEASGLSDASINEILEIRRRLGGGTGLGLPREDSGVVGSGVVGLARNVEIESQSGSELTSKTESILDHKKPDPSHAITLSEKLFFEMINGSKPLHVGRELINKGDRISSIRETARLADQLAADLEDLSMYRKADSLRILASQIRKTARQNSSTAQVPRKIR